MQDNAAAPKSDRHAPAQEKNDREVSEVGDEEKGGAGGAGGVRDSFNGLINHCNLISNFEAKEERQT